MTLVLLEPAVADEGVVSDVLHVRAMLSVVGYVRVVEVDFGDSGCNN